MKILRRLRGAALALLLAGCHPALLTTQRPSEEFSLYLDRGQTDARWDGSVGKGFGLFAAGGLPAASRQFEKAVSAGCDDGLVLFHLAACSYVAGGNARAGELLRAAIPALDARYAGTTYPARARNLRAIALMDEGRTAEAEGALKEALRKAPPLAETHSNLGKLYAAQNRQGEAFLEFEQALQLDPNDATARLNLGFLYA